MPPKKKEEAEPDKKDRIAIIETQKCKPKKCRHECKRSCPVVRMGKECIVVDERSKVAFLSEELCIGCGICVKKCPFEAIQIINLPKNLEKSTMHRYGANTFKLHRLPSPRAGQVLGLVGTNGIGKSTALKILAGKQKPNLGRFDNPPEWAEILGYFRGSELQNYFTRILVNTILYTPTLCIHTNTRAVASRVARHTVARWLPAKCNKHKLLLGKPNLADTPGPPHSPPFKFMLGGQLEVHHQATVRGPHPQGRQGHGGRGDQDQGGPGQLGRNAQHARAPPRPGPAGTRLSAQVKSRQVLVLHKNKENLRAVLP
jgi:ferredoxin